MRKRHHYFISFLTGLGVVATAALLAPAGRKARRRIAKMARQTGRTLKQRYERSMEMADLRKKARQKVNEAAEAARKAMDKAIDTSKDVAHAAGKKLEQGGKRLQNA